MQSDAELRHFVNALHEANHQPYLFGGFDYSDYEVELLNRILRSVHDLTAEHFGTSIVPTAAFLTSIDLFRLVKQIEGRAGRPARLHLPWWKEAAFWREPPPIVPNIVISDAVLCEMTELARGSLLRVVARWFGGNSRLFIYGGPGQAMFADQQQLRTELSSAGLEPVADGEVVVCTVPAMVERAPAIDAWSFLPEAARGVSDDVRFWQFARGG